MDLAVTSTVDWMSSETSTIKKQTLLAYELANVIKTHEYFVGILHLSFSPKPVLTFPTGSLVRMPSLVRVVRRCSTASPESAMRKHPTEGCPKMVDTPIVAM